MRAGFGFGPRQCGRAKKEGVCSPPSSELFGFEGLFDDAADDRRGRSVLFPGDLRDLLVGLVVERDRDMSVFLFHLFFPLLIIGSISHHHDR